MKILVVDDEELAIENMVALLQDYDDSCIVYTSTEPAKSVDIFFKELPDVVLLDINMPGINGMELGKIFLEKTHIVFVTAYSEYAVEAFNLNAVDYLLKPVDEERFAETMQKVKRHMQLPLSGKSTQIASLKTLLDMLAKPPSPNPGNVIAVKEVGKIRLIDIAEVDYLMGSGNYVEIYLSNGQMILHRETMTAMEDKLNKNEFIRVHRSSIVRISAICELLCNKHGDYAIKLKNGIELPIARQSKQQVLTLFT